MIPPFFKRASRLTIRNVVPVLLQGCSGVGKTKVLEALQGNFDAIPVEHRTERRSTSKLVLEAADLRLAITDVPGDFGEGLFSDERASALDAHRGRTALIINVVSYGFHTPDLPVDQRPPSQSAAQHCETHRKLEIQGIAQSWASFSPPDGFPALVCVTLIAKPDLWWGQRDSVIAHYSSGEYDERISDLGKSGSAEPSIFRNIVLPCQLVDRPPSELRHFFGVEVSGSRPEISEVEEMRSNFIGLLQKVARK